MPSANLKVFTHNEYQISYPENWQVFGDQSSSVTIAPKSGVSQNAVAYGVMIANYQPEEAGESLDSATHELVASLRQSNPDLKQIGRDETIRTKSVTGKSSELIGSSPIKDAQGKALQERDWLVAIARRDARVDCRQVQAAAQRNDCPGRPGYRAEAAARRSSRVRRG